MPPVGVRVSSNVETQNILQEKTVTPSPGRYPRMTAGRAQTSTASVTWTKAGPDTLMERVLAPANLKRAYQRVVSNKGAPGADACATGSRSCCADHGGARWLRSSSEYPVLRGWAGYFKLSQSKSPLEDLDGWVRRKLRCVLWSQWKQSSTRARNLMRLGLNKGRACKSSTNGQGPWWNSGASHMNQALPKKLWDNLGLVSILDTINRLSRIT